MSGEEDKESGNEDFNDMEESETQRKGEQATKEKVSDGSKLEEFIKKVEIRKKELEEAVSDTKISKRKMAQMALQLCEECMDWGKNCDRWEKNMQWQLKEDKMMQVKPNTELRELERRLEECKKATADQMRVIQGECQEIGGRLESERIRERAQNRQTRQNESNFQNSETQECREELQTSGRSLRRASETWENERRDREERKSIKGLESVITSMALPSVRTFSGRGGVKEFREFVERLDMKYGQLMNEDQLVTVYRQHLEGDAAKIFDTLPREIKNGPYRGIVSKMRERLQGDQTIQKYDAQRKLDKLYKRESESVTQFCCYLENITVEAYPEASPEMLSEIRAGKLVNALPNFEHQVQLFKILDEADSYDKYERLREEALKLELLERRKVIIREEKRMKFPMRAGDRERQRDTIGSRYTNGSHNTRSSEQRNVTYTVNQSLNPNARPFISTQSNPRPVERMGSQGQVTRTTRCFNCQEEGHYMNACPRKNTEPVRNVGTRKVETKTQKERAGTVPFFGALWKTQADFNGVTCTVVIDTGAESTVIPRKIMEEIERTGRDKVEWQEARELMNDAIGRPIEILGKTEMRVKMEGTEQSMIGVFVVDSKEDYILLGQNAREIWEKWREKEKEGKPVSIAKRVCIAPGEERDVEVNVPNSSGKIMLWAEKEGIGSGVMEEKRGKGRVRVSNATQIPMILKKDEVIGEGEEPIWLDVQLIEKTSISEEERQGRGAEVLNAIESKAKIKSSLCKQVVLEFLDVFATKDEEMGRTDLVEHTIDTGESAPIRQNPRPVPLGLQKEVKEKMKDMLSQGIISESSSPWISPLVIAQKKDNSLRLCVDYRKLNEVNKK